MTQLSHISRLLWSILKMVILTLATSGNVALICIVVNQVMSTFQMLSTIAELSYPRQRCINDCSQTV